MQWLLDNLKSAKQRQSGTLVGKLQCGTSDRRSFQGDFAPAIANLIKENNYWSD
jgi:hypothetical protein